MKKVCKLFDIIAPKKPSSELGLYKTHVGMGLEIELENVFGIDMDSIKDYWQIKTDNSLRNSGIEFIMKSPESGVALEKAIKCISNLFNSFIEPPHISHRCSMHTHIDFRNRDITEIKAFFYLYTLLEPLIYSLSSKDRYCNLYCLGLSNATSALAKFGIAASDSADNFFKTTEQWCKYTGINLRPITYLGSVEIRTHAGSLDYANIIRWTQVLNYMYSFIIGKDKDAILKYAHTAPQKLISDVFIDTYLPPASIDSLVTYWPNVVRNVLYMELIAEFREQHSEEETINIYEVI